jgi:predicted enzyme related to lactoylglutathione lyase
MGHPVVHFEIAGKDKAKLDSFYGSLFGWKTQDVPGMSYSMVTAEDGGIGGGIGAAPDGGSGHVTFYVQADDPQAVLDRAAQLGGKTVMPVTAISDQVTIALVADPEGHVVGIVKGM